LSESGPDDDFDEVNRILGRNVQVAREAMNITQEELGRRSNLPRSRVGKLERAEKGADTNPTLRTIVALARGLGLFPAQTYQLLSPTGGVQREPSDLPEIGERLVSPDGCLSIELPESEALSAARAVAAQTGRPIALLDPKTREVVGIAGNVTKAHLLRR
jgi:transcriptional regulator with XRE-family HTH domain